ncbi:universal stress protein [Pseudonocardia sp. C8]|uniref:universal stress protein n=1 Tax=Pseudonocardia sp. C8 TaxID=2762759 RepID=UPI001642B3D6|nr:universal stress protein [Pseudonocardia sp. C8]MBC3194824.1 universal stress protein [Pseudonocardia sp. C8]
MEDRCIVVGVDGSEGSRLALRWALREARYRGDAIKAVAAWHWEEFDEGLLDPTGRRAAEDDARRTLDREIDLALAEWPDEPPPLRREIAEGSPADVLVRAAEGTEMLVLGSHGHGRFRHATLGSVGEKCVRSATCPVVILPLPHRQRGRARHSSAEAVG